MDAGTVEDLRASDPVERLLEDSWESRSRRTSRHELIVETTAAAMFLAVAVPMAAPALAQDRVPLGLALLLVALYAIVSRTIKFPIGAGYVVPSYLVLVPMLVLLPPAVVPLLAAIGLVLGTTGRLIARRATAPHVAFAVADAWHAVGPAAVLTLAAPVHGAALAAVYVAAFCAGCLVDFVSSSLREALAAGIAPGLQFRVIAFVWLVDACIAPLGLLVADASRGAPARLLLLLPVMMLLLIADRDRSARIAEAQHRLGVAARQRTRLQAAVHRLGDAFAAKLELPALIDVVVHGSVDALDASAGRLVLEAPSMSPIRRAVGPGAFDTLLADVTRRVQSNGQPLQLARDGAHALALPFALGVDSRGALAVARESRAFSDDELALMLGLVQRAQTAATEILAHEALREQAHTDPLTRLGNRRKLAKDLGERLVKASLDAPIVLMLFDLDGFKAYNDTFGHIAGDALLARLGHKLDTAVSPHGTAYRLGGDEFCVLVPALSELQQAVSAAAAALEERGETFEIAASCGAVLLPHEATTAEYALQLADKRMYTRKHGRPSGAREQAHDVLIHIMRAKQHLLPDHRSGVARLAVRLGRRLGMTSEEVDELARAAALHDIGKVGIPDAILGKPGPLDAGEWEYVRQHTLLGERILSAAPALRPVAVIVRTTHERWDGSGYPDGLRTDEIPLAARIIAVCDTYDAITTERCYRPARSPELARAELEREAGRQFDPTVVAAFIEALTSPDGDDDHCEAVEGRCADTGGHAQLAAEVVGHVRELLRAARAPAGEVAEQAAQHAAIADQPEVRDARVVRQAEAVAAHVTPHGDGVVGDVFLVAVAGEVDEPRLRRVDDLAHREVGQDDPHLGGKP